MRQPARAGTGTPPATAGRVAVDPGTALEGDGARPEEEVMMDVTPAAIDYGEYEAELLLALDGLRILVVDDHADARAAITAVLVECGADVFPVASASAALEKLPQVRPDVMVSDISMPEMDGRGLIHCIRALDTSDGGAIPAVALTAYASATDCTRTLLAGYQLYLAKPFDPTELVGLIARLAGRTIL
jgi:CheY-like chemotaxis protein